MSPPYMGARREGFIADMYVPPQHRGGGIASGLHEGALRFFREAGLEAVALTVQERNAQGRNFWQRLGYQDTVREMRMRI